MLRPRLRLLPVLLVIAMACSSEQGVAPSGDSPAVIHARANVVPAASYSVNVLPLDGYFTDVNDANLIVGVVVGYGVSMQLGGTVKQLSSGPGGESRALAVNANGAIAGSVDLGKPSAPRVVPAVWQQTGANPILLSAVGEAYDINDFGLTVGSLSTKGHWFGFVWDTATGAVQLLPPLPGDKDTGGHRINNDGIILGSSGQRNAIWRQSGGGWVPTLVTGGIEAFGLDQSMGVVGRTGNKASFGTPNHAGFYNTIGPSTAWAVSRRGLATGDDAGASPGWPTSTVAFVADQAGGTTYLPLPATSWWQASFGYGVNACGLVVGTAWPFPATFTAQPVVWDPGC